MYPIQRLFSNRKEIALPHEPTKDQLDSYLSTKGFGVQDFGSYLSDIINIHSGGGGWQGVFQFQEDYVERLTDTLYNRGKKGGYQELSRLALTNPYASACIGTISEMISGIKWTMIREMPSGRKIENPNHPLLKLFMDPGLYDTRGTYRTRQSLFEPIIHHLYFAGELFIQLNNNDEPEIREIATGKTQMMMMNERNRQRPLTFTIIHPRSFQNFVRDTTGTIVGYEFRIHRGEMVSKDPMYISTDQVLHIKKYNCENEERGLPRISGAYTSLVQARMAAMWNTNLSKTGGRVQGFFSPKGMRPGQQLSKEKVRSIEAYLDETLRERQDRNLPMVMSGAMEYLANTVTPREADFMENDKLNGRKICSAMKVPSILAGDVDSQGLGGGTVMKAAEKFLWKNCLLPILNDFVEEININIASRYNDGYKLYFDTNQIEALQEETDTRSKWIHRSVGGPWRTQNEARKLEGLEKLDEEKYDLLVEKPNKNTERDDMRSDYDRDNEGENPNARN